MTKYIIYIFAILTITSELQAQDFQSLPVIKDMKSQGATFSESFIIDEHLEGIISNYRGQIYPIYKVRNTDHLIYGDLHDTQGNNLSDTHVKIYPTALGGHTLWDDLSEATIIHIEEASNVDLYTFIDTNCPYCKVQWHEMQPYIDQGLNVQYIPVGFLTKDSEKQAALILDNDKPYQALKSFEEGQRLPIDIDPKTLKPSAIKAVRKNTQLMQDLGVRATPASFYQGDDEMVYLIEGKIPSALIERLLD